MNDKLKVARLPEVEKEEFNISKVAKYISTTGGLINAKDPVDLTTIPSKNVVVTLDLSRDEDVKLSSNNVTMYDMAVMDSVYTLFKNGCTEFTPEMVAKVMSGNIKAYIKPQKAGAVRKSLEKLAGIRISLDCTDEFRARGIQFKEGERVILTDYLLPLREVQLRAANNNIVLSGFLLKEIPVLYDYADRIGRIATIPRELLNVKGVTDTEDGILVRRYVVRRIEELKRARNKSGLKEIIYYDNELQKGIISELWYDKEFKNVRDKKSEVHRMMKKVLESYVNDRYIKSYKEITEGNSVIGVEIDI